MKYYLIYLLNYKESDSVILKDSYIDRGDALNSLERNAIEYIKELQGKQQADICKQEKTCADILADTNLKEGLYFRKDGESIILYEKITIVKPGTIWNSSSLKLNKVGKFYITEYNFDDSIFRCNCMLTQKSVPRTVKPEASLSFIDELKNMNGKFNLKPTKNSRLSKKVTKVQNVTKGQNVIKGSFDDICDTVTNF